MTLRSQMKKPVVGMAEDRHHHNEIVIEHPLHSQTQITAAAQVEIYPTMKYTQDNQSQQDLNHSVSPQGVSAHWNTPQSHNNVRGVDRGRARHDDHNSGKLINVLINIFHCSQL